MDNLSSHKVAGVAAAIRSVGARVRYLPPYRPDLNPIENMFAKLKHLIRKSGERMMDALWETIGRLRELITPTNVKTTSVTQDPGKPKML